MDERVGKPTLLKEINSRLLLRAIRDKGPVSRPQLSEMTSLSLPTVNARVKRLIEAEFVREAGHTARHTRSQGGKSAGLVEFNGKYGYVAGIDIGGHQVSLAVVADLTGDVVARERRVLEQPVDAEKVLEMIWASLDPTLAKEGIEASDLMAVGLSVPGAVDPITKEVTAVANVPGWAEAELTDRLSERLGRPLVIENNVNAAMEGERWLGAARGVRDAVFVAIGAGLGSGILMDGRIRSGWRGAAGEIGFQRDLQDDTPLQGVSGPLERAVSGRSIAARYRQLAEDTEKKVTARIVFESADHGDFTAQRVVHEVTSMLAGGIVNLCAVLAPELVILGGGVAGAGEQLVAPVRQRLEKALPYPPRLVLSELGDEASVLGAVRFALNEVDESEFNFSASLGDTEASEVEV